MRRLIAVLAALGLIAAAVPPALAAQGDIVVADRVVFRIRFPAGGMTIEQRVVQVQQRITNALTYGKNIQVTIRMAGSDPVIYAGTQMIVTVDSAHARANSTTQRALAEIWARNLAEALPLAKPIPQPGGP